jgi:hypothetical protein
MVLFSQGGSKIPEPPVSQSTASGDWGGGSVTSALLLKAKRCLLSRINDEP